MTDTPALATHFYVDESGNSGDLVRAGNTLDFDAQEIFALAAIGVDDMGELSAELDRLKAKYRVQAPELKATAIKGKPGFIRELAQFLAARDMPVFVEIVDKRYFLVATMINHFVMPPVGEMDRTPEVQWFRTVLGETLYARAPSEVLGAYISACDAPCAASITAAFDVLLDWLDSEGPTDEVCHALRYFTADSLQDFLAAGSQSEAAQRRCLPVADIGTRGQSIWILPNLSSLMNIQARINLYRRRALNDVVITHDEQAHFEAILRDGKAMAEKLATGGNAMQVRFADYDFVEKPQLEFARSADVAAIQAADLLAGFVMRFVKAVLHNGEQPASETREAFHALLELTETEQGRGFNFVLATQDMLRLGILPA